MTSILSMKRLGLCDNGDFLGLGRILHVELRNRPDILIAE